MMWLKMSRRSLSTAIDLCALGLDSIEETEDEFRIGAMVTLRQLEKHPGLAAYSCGAVEAALKDIVGVQFRNGATVGGSLWRRMGFSDVLAIFMAMDSYVELYKGGIVQKSTAAFADYAANNVAVAGNMWGSAEYRKALVPVLTRRALTALGEAL